MYKQISNNRWINCREIESLIVVDNEQLQIMTCSGKIYRTDYPIEYYLDGLGPVGIEHYADKLDRKLHKFDNGDERIKKLKEHLDSHAQSFKEKLDEELNDL